MFLFGANIAAESPDIKEISTAIPPKMPLEIDPAIISLVALSESYAKYYLGLQIVSAKHRLLMKKVLQFEITWKAFLK